jgi:hypothetical protein
MATRGCRAATHTPLIPQRCTFCPVVRLQSSMASKGGSGGGSAGAGSASGPALPSDIAVYLEACAKAANAAVEAALSGGTLTDDIGQALCSVGVASTSVSTGGPASAAPHIGTWSVSLFQPCTLAEFVAGTLCALATTGETITKCGKKLPPGQQALTGAERKAAEAARRAELAHAVSAVLAPVYVCYLGAVEHTHAAFFCAPPPHTHTSLTSKEWAGSFTWCGAGFALLPRTALPTSRSRPPPPLMASPYSCACLRPTRMKRR